ncbi:hypothetical protein MKX01_022689 [Papaver californicum]|nr:hypothetical protein MKX01_022689 [Papaver californicum]
MQTPQLLAYLPECQATIKGCRLLELFCTFKSFNTTDFPLRRLSFPSVFNNTFIMCASLSRDAPKYSKHECTHVWKPSNSRTCK